ncbi:FAD-dependent oxidoreductase [Rhizobium rhizogenes]|uniref:FAD-dependent oxidoreductase n=1 Tax=Rhizobium rhizogenes TaxID=359 RepID=UPI001F2548D6|nr:FAD-dependent oxidoreductase [Rhizobium rhizogenes]
MPPFEKAERTHDEQEKLDLLAYVAIGGGPTGVEMAGAISELGRFMISRDFRNIHPEQLRVVLIEAGPKILAAFPDELIDYARRYLEQIGVEVRTSHRVSSTSCQPASRMQDEFIRAGCVTGSFRRTY